MADTQRKITRRQLYDLVWAHPLSKLAPDFGTSGNGLAKICRRAEIPVPQPGHWAKLQHGKRVSKPRLKAAPPGQSEELVIEASPPGRATLEVAMPEPLASLYRVDRDSTVPIVVPNAPKPHPLVAQWPPAKKPMYGPAHFTATAEGRRRRMASVLFREIEKRGGTVLAGDSDRNFKVRFFGNTIDVAFAERLTMVTIPPDPKRSYSHETKEWRPTGVLRLRFENYFDVPVRREWNDRPERPIESQLREILTFLFIAVEAERERNARLAEEERKREEERQRRIAVEAQRRRDREHVNALLAESESWEKARRLRQYVDAVIAHHGNAAAEWASWARAVADRLDPIRASGALASP